MSNDYKDTLNLPKSTFPMRAALAKKEPELLKFWSDVDLYQKLMDRAKDSTPFILHDGPPYANGNIHIGTAFNKILKDFIPKYKWMRGYRAHYVPGWDTHGLPIELRVLKDANLTKDSIEPVELRRRCKTYALHYIDVQREEFKRLGVLGDWEHPYITLLPKYEAAELNVLADMIEKGLVYRGLKSVFWCTDCQTALAAAEIEYEDIASPSIYVAYPLLAELPLPQGVKPFVIIWTTTPWTLPASLAVAIHPSYDYAFYRVGDRVYLVAKELAPLVEKETGLHFEEVLLERKGKELEGLTVGHPFYEDRIVPLVLADYVLLDQGTGCVHTAPGHGVEDFETGVRYNLPILNPVDEKGFFLPDTPLVGGLSLEEAEEKILRALRERGRLLGSSKIVHSYPHCWRCKRPVIYRATEQYFVAVSAFRDQALKSIDEVKWIPEWGRERIWNMVKERSDWCISRQRIWGVPIPAFHCEDCGELILSAPYVRKVSEKVALRGTDVWWEESPEELLGSLCKCPKCGSGRLRKETDILDVWFDSGSSHAAVLEARPDLRWPADMYLEGSDQHRGYFQTSLLTSVATKGRAPYDSVLTHGFIVDGEGRKMSKSLGNVVNPQDIIGQHGADVLRLWVASTDYRNDVRISDTILNNLIESYRRVRNTIRFMLGNLFDFDPKADSVPVCDMEEIDRWILCRLQRVIDRVTRGFEDYEFHVPTFTIHQFCVNDLSAFYLDVSKDRLYVNAPCDRSRRSCQTALWVILRSLLEMLAPILSFTAEEAWQCLRGIDGSLPESVFLSLWPEIDRELEDPLLEEKWQCILTVRGTVSKALEEARSKELIGQSLEASVSVERTEKFEDMASLDGALWEMVCIVSRFEWVEGTAAGDVISRDEDTGLVIGVSRAPGDKCPRCWKYSTRPSPEGLCPRCEAVLESLSSSRA